MRERNNESKENLILFKSKLGILNALNKDHKKRINNLQASVTEKNDSLETLNEKLKCLISECSKLQSQLTKKD